MQTTHFPAAICLMLAISAAALPAAAQDRTYNAPRHNDIRLDWCLTWGADCGRPAAVAFCQAHGYPGALHAAADRDPGYSSTRVISSGQVCDQPFCRGFQQIICR